MPVRVPDRPEDIFEPLVADLKQALGDDLLGVCLFGSAAAGRYQKGKSDLNFLILVDNQAQGVQSRLIPFYKRWAKANLAVPLVVTPWYLQSSRDSFPIELLVMSAAHKPVYGQDPLAEIQVRPADLRLQLERELKGKLLALRSGALASLGRKPELMGLLRRALPAFTALFQAYLHLEQGRFPLEPAQVLEAMARDGHEVSAFVKLEKVRSGELKPPAGELMAMVEQCLAQLVALCRAVDQLEVTKEPRS